MSRYKQPYSLYKRGDYWYYRTYTPDGVRTSGRSTGCKTKNGAKDYCNNLYLTGSLYRTDMNFKSYALHFYDDDSPYVKDRIRPMANNTIVGYRIRMKENIIPYFENVLLSDINYTKLKNFRTYLISKNYKPSVIVTTMSVLKHIIDNAFRDRLIPVNPFDYLESFNVTQSTRDAFSLDEVVYLYNNFPQEFKKTILLMALTGMRISEAVGTGIGANEIIFSDKGFWYIKIEKQFNHKKIIPVKMDSKRPLPIIPEIKELIGFEPLRLSAFYRAFTKIKPEFQNAEERLLCFHSLRHFFITNAKAKNINEGKVEFMAGHKEKTKVKRVYTNYKAEDLTDILEWQKETLKVITGQ